MSCYKFRGAYNNFTTISLSLLSGIQVENRRLAEFWEGITGLNKSSQKFSEIQVRGTGSMSNKTMRIVTSADLIPPLDGKPELQTERV